MTPLEQTNLPDQPRSLPGFEKIHRYFDKTRNMWGAKILPGEFYVTLHDEIIMTVLGSCVAACVRDRKLGLGGMNHFMLPSTTDAAALAVGSSAARYGNFAMEHLINTILKNGGRRENLEIKIFGGGKILANMTDVGYRNIQFIREYIKTENLILISEDVGDIYPRKVAYYPASGKAQVKKLHSLHNNTVVDRERTYIDDLSKRDVGGDVELF